MSEELPTRPRGNWNRFWVSVWGIKPNLQLWAPPAASSVLQDTRTSTFSAPASLETLSQTPGSRHTQVLESVKQGYLTAQRYLHNGFCRKNKSYSHLTHWTSKPSPGSSMEYSMPKAIRCLSTLLLSLLLLLVELKLVTKVGNQIPLASTDKACWAVKMKLKENHVSPASWCIFLPSQRCNSASGSPGQSRALDEGTTRTGPRQRCMIHPPACLLWLTLLLSSLSVLFARRCADWICSERAPRGEHEIHLLLAPSDVSNW